MTRFDAYKFSFFPSAIKIWNPLPQHTGIEQSLSVIEMYWAVDNRLLAMMFQFYAS